MHVYEFKLIWDLKITDVWATKGILRNGSSRIWVEQKQTIWNNLYTDCKYKDFYKALIHKIVI